MSINGDVQLAAAKELRELLSPGDMIYTKLVHVSRSGMYRVIDCYVIRSNEPRRISWSVAQLTEGYDRRHEGVKASGCGMDMGFHVVYSLSRTLFPLGFGCIGERCPSNDHTNGDHDYTPNTKAEDENGHFDSHWHKDGGYALRQCWL